MIFHENHLLADDSYEISYLIFSKSGKDVEKFVVCCSRDWVNCSHSHYDETYHAKIQKIPLGREGGPENFF